jgi:hypothetical protein
LLRLEHNADEMNRPTPLFFFSICAVVDFAFGYIKWHTVGAGVVAVVCGLPSTALLFWGFRTSGKGKRLTMHHDNRIHGAGRTPEPNLLDSIPKTVWREVYSGRWDGLRPVQKAEFVVELVFFALFIGGFVYNSYIRDGHALSLVVSFGVVWLILGAFFYLLTWFIR